MDSVMSQPSPFDSKSTKVDIIYHFIVLIYTYRLQLDILINTYRYQYEQEIRQLTTPSNGFGPY